MPGADSLRLRVSEQTAAAELGFFELSDTRKGARLGGINTYAYVGGAPLSFIDPDGLQVAIPAPLIAPMAGAISRPAVGTLVDPIVTPGLPDPNDPNNSQKCKSLETRIKNLKDEIYNKRYPDLETNPGKLPRRIGPGEALLLRMIDQFPYVLTQISSVESKRSAALCSRLADNFEDDLLQYAEFPEEHLDFCLTLLSSEQYYSKPGIWNFVLAVNNAKDALSASQYESIAAAFENNFGNYTDKELCFAVCDFIARNLELSKAADLLRKLKQQELHKSAELQGYVDEGFFILEQEKKRAARSAAN